MDWEICGSKVTFDVAGDVNKENSGVKLSFKELEALKELRLNLSKAEATLWDEIKNKKGASKFRKKYTIGAFMVDYVCLAKNLIVEFSGKEDEAARTEFFHKEGFNVIRFTNEEVLQNVLKVVSEINFAIQFPKVIEKTEKVGVASNQMKILIKLKYLQPDLIQFLECHL